MEGCSAALHDQLLLTGRPRRRLRVLAVPRQARQLPHPEPDGHRAIAVPGGFELRDHTFELVTADLRCEPWKRPEPRDDCCCVGDLTYQAICEPCGWHGIAADENSAVEGSHDHALPCWRELPIVPARLRGIDKIGLSKAARKWIEEQYTAAMQIAGAPVITERGIGTRHVPGRSPWGGYDLSHTATDPQRKVAPCKQRRTPGVSLKSPHVAAAPRGLALGDDERSEENT